jgi:hypothetical protein
VLFGARTSAPTLRTADTRAIDVRVLPDDDGLEALPVVIDGVSRAPRAVADGGLLDAPMVPDFGYWANEPHVVPAAAPQLSPKSFRHMVYFAPGQLDALYNWWQRRANCGRVEMRGLTLHEPQRHRNMWTLSADLRGAGARPIRMELVLWRCIGEWARVTLDPQRSVLGTRRYFRVGHRVLDALCEQLAQEL